MPFIEGIDLAKAKFFQANLENKKDRRGTNFSKTVALDGLREGKFFDKTMFMATEIILLRFGFNFNASEAFNKLKYLVLMTYKVCTEEYWTKWEKVQSAPLDGSKTRPKTSKERWENG